MTQKATPQIMPPNYAQNYAKMSQKNDWKKKQAQEPSIKPGKTQNFDVILYI